MQGGGGAGLSCFWCRPTGFKKAASTKITPTPSVYARVAIFLFFLFSLSDFLLELKKQKKTKIPPHGTTAPCPTVPSGDQLTHYSCNFTIFGDSSIHHHSLKTKSDHARFITHPSNFHTVLASYIKCRQALMHSAFAVKLIFPAHRPCSPCPDSRGFNAVRPLHAPHKHNANASALMLCRHFTPSPSTVCTAHILYKILRGGECGKGCNAAPTQNPAAAMLKKHG